jgi:pyrroloquinoline quinone (PQQ) biosynthesis protein C
MVHQPTARADHEQLIRPNTTLPFLRDLEAEAQAHKAVQHPYLLALSEGTLRDPRRALQDFASEYQGYSAWFPRFLSALEERLPRDLRNILDENKDEEGGRYDEETLLEIEAAGLRREWVDGVPHPELFSRFQRALGVEPNAAVDPNSPVARWRNQLLQTLEGDHPAAAIGALGLGTELVVSGMYARVLRSVDRFASVHPEDRSFLVLHVLVDDSHAASLLELAAHFALNAEGRAAIARGMHSALDLRSEFWDALYERATQGQEDAA